MASSAGGAAADDAAAPDDEGGAAVPVLACGRCRNPLAPSASVLRERAATWDAAVYAYELDVCDLEDVWCYSATNPGAHRFDVVRVAPQAGAHGDDHGAGAAVDAASTLVTAGEPTAEHSWFPGFAWQFAHCGFCDAHLGWAFSRDGDEGGGGGGAGAGAAAKPTVDFFGLVVTKMTQQEASADDLAAAARLLGELRVHVAAYSEHMRVAIMCLNNLPLAVAAPFFDQIHAMSVDPASRLRSGDLAESVRQAHEEFVRSQAEVSSSDGQEQESEDDDGNDDDDGHGGAGEDEGDSDSSEEFADAQEDH